MHRKTAQSLILNRYAQRPKPLMQMSANAPITFRVVTCKRSPTCKPMRMPLQAVWADGERQTPSRGGQVACAFFVRLARTRS